MPPQPTTLHDLLPLVQQLLHNLLHDLLPFLPPLHLHLLRRIPHQPHRLPHLPKIRHNLLPPAIPLIKQPHAPLHLLRRCLVLLRQIRLLERAAVLAQVFAHGFLLVFAQEGGGAGAPQELLEAVDVLFVEELAAEVVEVEACFHLGWVLAWHGEKCGRGDRGGLGE